MSEDRLMGQQLDEYRLEKLLGQGGMARVYRGLDVGLKRYAAIKIIDTPFQRDEAYLRRFEVEAQAIAQLDHPNIVSLYRYGHAQDVLYMAMKYVEGADLQAVLSGYEQNGELMPWKEALRVLREIASALDYAHSKGVIHRDIKPSNIMLDEQGRAYLTDFGLVLLTAQGTQGQIFGTPQYIAPEQAISSAGAVPQTDFYAIGVILYRMVTGTLPFDHDDMLEIAMLHMTEEPPPPSQHCPEISYALESVILKSLAKEPKDRYSDGAALIAALEAIGAEVPPLAMAPALSIMDRVALDMDLPPPPISPSEPLSSTTTAAAISSKISSFSPKLVWIGVIVLLLLLLAGALSLFGDGDDDVGETAVSVPTKPVDDAEETVAENNPMPLPQKTNTPVHSPTAEPEADTVITTPEVETTSTISPTPSSTAMPAVSPIPAQTNTPVYLYLPIIIKEP